MEFLVAKITTSAGHSFAAAILDHDCKCIFLARNSCTWPQICMASFRDPLATRTTATIELSQTLVVESPWVAFVVEAFAMVVAFAFGAIVAVQRSPSIMVVAAAGLVSLVYLEDAGNGSLNACNLHRICKVFDHLLGRGHDHPSLLSNCFTFKVRSFSLVARPLPSLEMACCTQSLLAQNSRTFW